MRLTKEDKAAFVRAIMQDIPQIDYETQYQKLYQQFAVDAMHPKLRAVYDDKELRDSIDDQYVHKYGSPFSSFHVYRQKNWKLTDEQKQQLDAIADAANAQEEQRYELEERLRATINGCSTLKTARERLPEFEKYLPADRDGTGVSNLPVANLVADLVKLGWPKEGMQPQGV